MSLAEACIKGSKLCKLELTKDIRYEVFQGMEHYYESFIFVTEWKGENYLIRLKLPLGIEDFKELRERQCYYIDKTGLIQELLEETFKVNLITRPRRFGKTLTISMLAAFFDVREESQMIFQELEISKEVELCKEWQNQYPVLFVSFKDVNGEHFEDAYGLLQFSISSLCVEHAYLENSDFVDEADKEIFWRLKCQKGNLTEVQSALLILTRMMAAHYGKSVILLMDEYDVPLAKASDRGYYLEMLNVIRSMLGLVWKTNPFLKFAVVTGCLRIAKESIFTGANNFIANSISGEHYQSYFGFLESEVLDLLKVAGLSEHFIELKQWYDGYRFGKKEVYCPWDVINHVRILQVNPKAKPANYWKDTSHNEIIRRFIDQQGMNINDKFEILLSGGVIWETIAEDLTYDKIDSTEENLWSILYLTGYLTQADLPFEEEEDEGKIALRIPNEEGKTIFAETIAKWFRDTVITMDRKSFFQAWWNGEEEKLTNLLTDILFATISYYDYREDYYHAFLVGLFSGVGYRVSSNKESGTGRADVIVKDPKKRRAIVIEVKRAKTKLAMEKDCACAIEQMEREQYARTLFKGYQTILCYGAVFFEKECLIRLWK